ncbi:MAG TPA: hypothetical protein PK629_02600 [Oscillospiraceae bacterium]|nr:hypothetical protein [Oscillospiraceae bacterium]HPK34215.1 hypothetical protein [Oscillospiraceae bacterium]HPR74882.1 hypothetical protein [Oscillospiraceae bacterium]
MNLTHQFGKGAQADIYLEDGFIYKAFRSEDRKSDAFWEATVTSIAESAGLPVARIHEVVNIDGKPVLKMDYLNQETR